MFHLNVGGCVAFSSLYSEPWTVELLVKVKV